MVFVDTSAWYAAVIPTDPNHFAAQNWLTANSRPLVTSEYTLDEILTLLRSRGHRRRALDLGDMILLGDSVRLIAVDNDVLLRAWQVFRDFDDKNWSFTDCTSKVIIDQLGIDTSFAFDQHFCQFGNCSVVP